ncbi:MAG: hypothetical protein CME93_02430 [Hyphomonadaceae bacterium]|nr:hypothetical protein [Hyphomonadaceae bacterium]OUX94280.1 MAG: hypothetical protein CBB77_04015 [Hyphomonas sp. TMED17]
MITRLLIGEFIILLAFMGCLLAGRLLDPWPAYHTLTSVVDPDFELRRSRQNLTDILNNEPIPPEDARRARNTIALSAPFDTQPYIPALIQASETRDVDAMSSLATHITRLDPRERTARFVAAEIAAQQQDAVLLFDRLTRLITLDPERRQAYITRLAELSATPYGRDILFDAVAEKPDWARGLVNELARQSNDPAFLLQLFEYYPDGQNTYVKTLVREGELERAHIAFLDLLPQTRRPRVTTPYNREFDELEGAQPFNWVINRRFGSLEPTSGLAVSFFGGGSPEIAKQLIRAPAGPFLFTFVSQGETHANGGHLQWTISCARSDQVLLQAPVLDLTDTPTETSTAFEIPSANCHFQYLTLSGVAGAYPKITRAVFSETRLSGDAS